MCVEPIIRLADQVAVELLLASSRLFPGNQQNRFAFGVESECNAPFAVRCAEPQFLHVCVPRIVERVDAGAPHLGTKLLQQSTQRQNLNLNVFVQVVELGLEFVADLDNPCHTNSMPSVAYVVQYILLDWDGPEFDFLRAPKG